jgi:hypothetical protein
MAFRLRAIEGAGIPARTCSPEQAEGLAHDTCPRVWIFCGSVEMDTLVYLAGSLRRYSPQSRLLLLEWNAPAGVEGALFHRVLDETENSDILTQAVREAAGCGATRAAWENRAPGRP